MVATFLIDRPEARVVAERIGPVDAVWPAAPPSIPARHGMLRPVGERPFIVLNGSGNQHHETVPIVESLLAARGRPLLYLQIDAHPDTRPQYRWHLDCSSFAGRLIEHPGLLEVHILGRYLECTKPADYEGPYVDKLGYYKADLFAKLHQYLVGPSPLADIYLPYLAEAHASAKRSPSIKKVTKRRIAPPGGGRAVDALSVHWRTLAEMDEGAWPDAEVYLSIDLDVARARPVTDWRRGGAMAGGRPVFEDNQGDMEWDALLALIARVGAARRVVGADVCGLVERFDWLPEDRRADSVAAVAEVHAALVAIMD